MRRLRSSMMIVVLTLCAFGLARGATLRVPDDYAEIQAAIDASADGDKVLVAPGQYVITEPITFRGKAITVKSEDGPDDTIIRMGTPADPGRASVVVFENNETTDSVLDGFTITGGKGSLEASRNEWVGGGIFFNASSGTVRNCAIIQNTTTQGGGVLCFNPCSPNLINCTVAENSAELGFGGGVFAYGGSSASVTNCIIRDNAATGTWYGVGCGGGACCFGGSSLTMTYCTVAENSAGNTGGGVLSGENSSVTMTHCVIVGNMGSGWCGGVAGWQDASMTISNCTIWGNSGGTSGGGLGCYAGASATVTNSIFWGNTAAMGNEIHLEQAPAEFSITYSNVVGGQTEVSVEGGTLNWGVGNIDADPCFADPTNDDYHLKSQADRWDPNSQAWVQDDVTSPCIDAGDPNSSVAFEPYPNGGIINMGAYGGTAEASQSPSGLHSKYGGGAGEPNDPYLIYTAEQLNALGAEPNDYDKHFKLMADIDLSRYTYDRAVIAPDANDVAVLGGYPFDGIPFVGVFDGSRHTISHLTVTGAGYLGLFGRSDWPGTISNLSLEAVDVNGTCSDVAGLVGSNGGNIPNCSTTGSVTGGEYVGGLVGSIRRGSVTASYSTVAVNGNEDVGGLVGCNHGRVTASYSTGTATGSGGPRHRVGGLVGCNHGSITASYSTGAVSGEVAAGLVGLNEGWITMCYSTGAVSGGSPVGQGGLVCFNFNAQITACFWDMETSGRPMGLSGVLGTGLTTAEMQTASTFLEAGWDFIGETDNGTEDIWWILEGQDYPRLWWELIPEN